MNEFLGMIEEGMAQYKGLSFFLLGFPVMYILQSIATLFTNSEIIKFSKIFILTVTLLAYYSIMPVKDILLFEYEHHQIYFIQIFYAIFGLLCLKTTYQMYRVIFKTKS